MKHITPIALDRVNSYPLKERESKVNLDDFAHPWKPEGSLEQWLKSLPGILAAKDLLEIRDRMVEIVSSGKTVLLAMGAHGIKVGLNPVIIDLMERGILRGIAMNGACIIHDAELAMAGSTSEDVAASLGSGRFGMAEETGRFLNDAIIDGAKRGLGLGESVGEMLVREAFPFNRYSLLARAWELEHPRYGACGHRYRYYPLSSQCGWRGNRENLTPGFSDFFQPCDNFGRRHADQSRLRRHSS